MPHSKTGRKVEVGDKIISVAKYAGFPSQAMGGTVVSINEGDTCNAQIVPFGSRIFHMTLKDSVHVDDLAEFQDKEASK